jgi:hypothetical protein
MQFCGDKNSTRFLEQNICNLAYAQFEGDGDYDIPMLLPTHINNLADIPLQGFNYALKEKNPQNIGVHFFLHDYQFERVWNYPDRYTEVLSKFAFVLSPDFSPYSDMPRALKIYNVYRNRWCARYWQEFGIKVIPTITWSDEDSLSYCLNGVPKHSTIAISTMGEGRWANWISLRTHWQYVINTLEPDTILLYGKDIIDQYDLTGNIVHKRLINSKVAV